MTTKLASRSTEARLSAARASLAHVKEGEKGSAGPPNGSLLARPHSGSTSRARGRGREERVRWMDGWVDGWEPEMGWTTHGRTRPGDVPPLSGLTYMPACAPREIRMTTPPRRSVRSLARSAPHPCPCSLVPFTPLSSPRVSSPLRSSPSSPSSHPHRRRQRSRPQPLWAALSVQCS